MRVFYPFVTGSINYAIEVVQSDDGQSESQVWRSLSEAQDLVASGTAIIYDDHQALGDALQYASNRRNDYPIMQEQFDLLYHELETSGSLTTSGSWFKVITSVKDANPKPTGSA